MNQVFSGETPSAPPLPPTPSAPPLSSSAFGRGDPPDYNTINNPLLTPNLDFSGRYPRQLSEAEVKRKKIMTEFGRELPTYEESAARMNEGLLFTNLVRQAHYMFINDPKAFGSEEDNLDEERQVFRNTAAQFVADARARGPVLKDIDEEIRQTGEEQNRVLKAGVEIERDAALKYMLDTLEQVGRGISDRQLLAETKSQYNVSNSMLLGLVDVARGMNDRKRNSFNIFTYTGETPESKQKLEDLAQDDFEPLEVHPFTGQRQDDMTGNEYRTAEFGVRPEQVRVLTDEETRAFQRSKDFRRELESKFRDQIDPDRRQRGKTALSEFRRNLEEGGVLGLRWDGDGFVT